MKWTSKTPTEEGWYWINLHYEFGNTKRIVYVTYLFQRHDILCFTIDNEVYTVEDVIAEWCGPIPMPEE